MYRVLISQHFLIVMIILQLISRSFPADVADLWWITDYIEQHAETAPQRERSGSFETREQIAFQYVRQVLGVCLESM